MAARLAPSALAAIAAGALPFFLVSYSGGPPARRTGAPGDRSCLDASCHAGERFNDSASLMLDTGPQGLLYTPGGPTQRWIIRNADRQARAYGLQVSVRASADTARVQAGDLIPVNAASIAICEDEKFKDASGCFASAPLQFLHHTAPNPDGVFALDWTPPATDVGDVIVYVASNASVAGQRNSRIHHRAFRLTPSAIPALLPGEIAPGVLFTIVGAGFATATRAAKPEDVVDNLFPAALDGVSVTVNGKPAFVRHVSPGHVIALAPEDDAEGDVRVEVIRDGNVIMTLPAKLARFAPVLFAPTPEAPVRAGDSVALEGTGFGPVDPPVVIGRAFRGMAPCANPVNLRVGGVPAAIRFAGLLEPGRYQIIFTVPQLPQGEHAVEAEVEGAVSPSHIRLRVIR